MNKEFIEALDDLEKERGIPKVQLLDAVERALVSAYRGKNKHPEENIHVAIDENTGAIEIHHRKNVVEEVVDPNLEVSLEEMLQYDPDYKIGDVVDYNMPVEGLGRIAAQTAKQVVVQTVREIERSMVYDEFSGRQGELVTGYIQRVSNDTVFINIGRTESIMAPGEQVKTERYSVNGRLKFFILDVRKAQKGPQVFLSRSHPSLVKRLFELEVPEIQEGIVTIESLAREAGSRTKMAVATSDESVDPVGACVGNRGTRVNAVVDELFGEKIDIISWSDNTESNISSALSPSKVEKVVLDADGKAATAIVPDYQLSLAIGKEGQNVRLAAKLCGIKIDIKSHSQYFGEPQSTLVGTLDEDGYLNPADFMVDSKPEKEDASEDSVMDGDADAPDPETEAKAPVSLEEAEETAPGSAAEEAEETASESAADEAEETDSESAQDEAEETTSESAQDAAVMDTAEDAPEEVGEESAMETEEADEEEQNPSDEE